MTFSFTIQWQHFILFFGFGISYYFSFFKYSPLGDTYGIGGLVASSIFLIGSLITLVIYFSLGYFGLFN